MGLELDVFFSRLAVLDAAIDRRVALDEAKLRVRKGAYAFLYSRGPAVMEEIVRALADRMASHRRPRRLTYLGPEVKAGHLTFYGVSVDFPDDDRRALFFCFSPGDPEDGTSPHRFQVGWRIEGTLPSTHDWVDVSELGDESSFRAFFLTKLCHLLGMDDAQTPYGAP